MNQAKYLTPNLQIVDVDGNKDKIIETYQPKHQLNLLPEKPELKTLKKEHE